MAEADPAIAVTQGNRVPRRVGEKWWILEDLRLLDLGRPAGPGAPSWRQGYGTPVTWPVAGAQFGPRAPPWALISGFGSGLCRIVGLVGLSMLGRRRNLRGYAVPRSLAASGPG
jgi:hypothetical protein